MGVLVTGGAGFIGRHLVKALLKSEEFKVAVVDDLSNSNQLDFYKFISEGDAHILSQFLARDQLSFYKVDIRNKSALKRIFEKECVDTCIHLAARVSEVNPPRDPNSVFATNVDGTRNLLSLSALAHTQNFVFASSAAVYGNSRRRPLAEEDLTVPISAYGKSKLYGEQLVARSNSKIPNAKCLRVFNVYGGSQSESCTGVISRFSDRISKGLPPIIYGDGNQTRDFVSIDDVVESITLAAGLYERKHINEHDQELSFVNGQHNYHDKKSFLRQSVFNVGTGVPTTILDLTKIIAELATNDPQYLEPIYEYARDAGIIDSYANTKNSSINLGFNARVTLRSGLARALSIRNTNLIVS